MTISEFKKALRNNTPHVHVCYDIGRDCGRYVSITKKEALLIANDAENNGVELDVMVSQNNPGWLLIG